MKYFTTCTTLDELKKEFRRLAMLHHPDHGGDTETMKAINAEYDAVFPSFKLAYNRTAQTPTTETAQSTRRSFIFSPSCLLQPAIYTAVRSALRRLRPDGSAGLPPSSGGS